MQWPHEFNYFFSRLFTKISTAGTNNLDASRTLRESKMHRQPEVKTQVEKKDAFDAESEDYESRPSQSVKILGHSIPCKNCAKELASFYCPCGCFLCVFDMATHKCLITLRGTYSPDLVKGLR